MGRHVSVLIYIKRERERMRHKRGLCLSSMCLRSICLSVTCFQALKTYYYEPL